MSRACRGGARGQRGSGCSRCPCRRCLGSYASRTCCVTGTFAGPQRRLGGGEPHREQEHRAHPHAQHLSKSGGSLARGAHRRRRGAVGQRGAGREEGFPTAHANRPPAISSACSGWSAGGLVSVVGNQMTRSRLTRSWPRSSLPQACCRTRNCPTNPTCFRWKPCCFPSRPCRHRLRG